MRAHFTVLVFLFFLISTTLTVDAQVFENKPIKSNLLIEQGSIQYVDYQHINNDSSIWVDNESRKAGKEFGLRFGVPIEVNIDLFSKGIQTSFSDGSLIYRLGLSSAGAKTLNLIFDSFQLPEGAWMHIYNPSKTEVLGAFTKNNESTKYQFATTLISSDSIIIEVFIPNDIASKSLNIKTLVHGYRNFNQVVEGFGTSGDCNINVACPEGGAWSNQIRSVTFIIAGIGNNHICSGSLVNNVREDGTPYVLSANHCPVAPNNVVVFNYQSPFCMPNTDSSFAHAINGIDVLSRSGKSDFLLLKLSSTPANYFRPYYAGWNNTGIRPNNGTCIHHPDGDVKKISFDFKPSISKSYYNVGDNHWMVSSWDLGTTEPVSSGSPLFDENKLIVGQLHGGDALCDFPDEEDYFGKLSTSWSSFPDSTKQLKYWLDPDNSGASTLQGYDPLIPKGNVDLSLLGFVRNETNLCGLDSINPKVIVKNNGSQALSNFKLTFYLNNIPVKTDIIITTLPANATYTHVFSSIAVSEGFYTTKAHVSTTINDANPLNNWANSQLSISNQNLLVELIIQTDDDGAESNWELFSSSGSQLFSGGNYKSQPGGEEIRDTFCLYNGCFRFKFSDDFGDGICCSFGSGYYLMRDLNTGDTLFSNFTFTGSDSIHEFCMGDSCSIRARANIQNVSSASAQDGSISLEMLSGIPPFIFNWSNGATTASINNLDVGNYWVVVEDSSLCSDSIFFEVGIGSAVKNLEKQREGIHIFPNPNSGKFTVVGMPNNERYFLTLLNQNGKEITKQSGTTSNNLEIQFENLKSGIYVLRFITTKSLYQSRIVVVK